MCILFLSVNASPMPESYKLVLASNRDEYYKRPAKSAHFWSSNPDIVGGQDMEPGREGGTWLGLVKTGKIGVLLNILSDSQSPDKLGRGFLVNDFLNADGVDGYQYSKKLHENAASYNPFNLVTIDFIKKAGPNVTYYSSQVHDDYPIRLEGTNVHAFGNSLLHIPFKKVIDGKERIVEAIKCNGKKSQKEELIESLLKTLKCTETFFPDEQIQKQAPGYPFHVLEGMSSKFVYLPSEGYGSRTHTIILVDDKNRVEFHEWTMVEPIDPESPKMEYTKYEFDFHLKD